MTECSACHSTSSTAGGLNLGTESTAYTVLTTMSTGSGTAFVVSGDAAASYLYMKMTGSGAGDIMPPDESSTPADIALVEAWINEGANP